MQLLHKRLKESDPYRSRYIHCKERSIIYKEGVSRVFTRRLRVSFSFKPAANESAILVYCAQNYRGVGNFIALILYKMRLKFIFDMGTGVDELNPDYSVEPGKWHHVNVSRDYKTASLIFNSEMPIKKSFPDSSSSMSLKTLIYIGGVNKRKISINKNIKVKSSFRGCLDEISLHFTKSDAQKSLAESTNIQECYPSHPNSTGEKIASKATSEIPVTTVDHCLAKPCINGLCQNVHPNDYSCTCQYGYVGRNCENILKQCELLQPCMNGGTCADVPGSFKCDCRYGFSGQNCSKSVDIVEDVTFQGEGWLELTNAVMTHTDEREMIGFEISTNETNGLLMWHGDNNAKSSAHKYMSLAVVDGYVEFQYSLGSGPVILRVNSMKVNDGKRHRIILTRHGREGSVELDGEFIEIGSSDGRNYQLDIVGNIFLGGVPDYSMTHGKYGAGFSGCIHTFEVQDSGAINLGKAAITGKNVAPCTRTRWIPSSLVFTDAGDDLFDAFVPPPPVNVIHPKPSANKAATTLITNRVTVISTTLLLRIVWESSLRFPAVVCIL